MLYSGTEEGGARCSQRRLERILYVRLKIELKINAAKTSGGSP